MLFLMPAFLCHLYSRCCTHLTVFDIVCASLFRIPTQHNTRCFLQTPGDGVGGAVYTPVDEISRLPITVGRPDYEQYFSQIEGCVHFLTVR